MDILTQYCISSLNKLILSYTYNVLTLTFEEPGNIRIEKETSKHIINNKSMNFDKDNKQYIYKCHNTPLYDSEIYKCDTLTNIYIKYNEQINISFKGLSTTIQTISSDGYIGLINEGYNFYKQYSLMTIPKNINLQFMTTMKHLFDLAISFNSDISHWDVSNIQSMEFMFSDAISFNQNINNWNTKNVNNMKCMFRNAKKFNKSYVSGWIIPKHNSKRFEMFV